MDIADAFRLQASACDKLGSPLYARLVSVAAENIDDAGVLAPLVTEWSGDPVKDALALRVMAGVHCAALTGSAPRLAEHFPTTGGEVRWPGCSEAFVDTLGARPAALVEALQRPPQTNEIGRSGILLGGLLEVSRLTGMPLRLLELGSSAGLNLLLDRFRYELGDSPWGATNSPVVVKTQWSGDQPSLETPLEIVDRRGCDVNPLRPGDAAAENRLKSFVWADQIERFARLNQAIEMARRHPVIIDPESADSWLPDRLASPSPGAATVVMHSVVTQYLKPEVRQAVVETIRRAGERASHDTPVAWLSLEPGKPWFRLRLSVWPYGLDLMLAVADPHGRWAHWRTGAAVGGFHSGA